MIVCGKPLEDTCCASRGHAGRCESVGDYVSGERAAEAAALRAKLADTEAALIRLACNPQSAVSELRAKLAEAERAGETWGTAVADATRMLRTLGRPSAAAALERAFSAFLARKGGT